MKKVFFVLALGCVTTASNAQGASFAGSNFTATGTTSLSAPGAPTLACATNLSGTVNTDGTATITTASFSGGTLNICAAITLKTPIKLTASSATSLAVESLAITSPVSCGPQVVAATWANGGPSQFHVFPIVINPGGCTVSIHLNVTGATIVP